MAQTVEGGDLRADASSLKEDIQVVRAGADRLDDVRPMWLLIHRQHLALGDPRRGKPRTDDESWELKRRHYEEWLQRPDSFLLIAELDGRPLGYTIVEARTFAPNPDWHAPERKAWIEDLAVTPDLQGARVGKLLIDAIKVEAERLDLPALAGEILAANEDAIRFYEREGGYRTATLIEYRFAEEPGVREDVEIVDDTNGGTR